jgi:cysteine desulfuration protein SufE
MPALDDLTLEQLYEEFSELPDWGDRCDFLIDVGMDLPRLAASERVESNRVHGCQSNVWMVANVRRDRVPPTLEIRAESDSMFVNGLIAIVLMIFDGRSAAEILEIDEEAVFRRLDLHRQLSTQRKNGLAGMVQRIRTLAAEALRKAS